MMKSSEIICKLFNEHLFYSVVIVERNEKRSTKTANWIESSKYWKFSEDDDDNPTKPNQTKAKR